MLRYFLIGFFLSLYAAVLGQEMVEIEPFDNSFRSKKTYYKKPSELVDILTMNKVTEHEKFQSIFYWVINNIDYDYGAYLSKKGSPSARIRDILKHRVALCGDYANLMDTLCLMAGIQSMRVNGYAKDETFDVQDSIYVANHAWNIVRLNNLWYPYDITWSKGAFAWHYTKFSQWIINQRKKLKYTIVKVKLKDKNYRHYWNIKCDQTTLEADEEEFNRFTHKFVYKQKLRRWILGQFRLRIKLGYKESKSLDFFLSEPEIFSITHTPEDPAFSLVRSQPFREFESDSDYYHLSARTYEGQNRSGRTCPQCVSASAGSEFEKVTRLKYSSLAYNRKNKFTPALCDYSIAVLKFRESLPVQDSAEKITLLDSSLMLLGESKRNLALSSGNIRSEFDQQKRKNRKKFNMVLDSVDINRRFIRGQIHKVTTETNHIRNLENSQGVDLQAYKSKTRSLNNFKRSKEIEQDRKSVQKTIDFLLEEVKKNNACIDSLNDLIAVQRSLFSELAPDLSERIWQRVKEQDSLVAPLSRRIYLRAYFNDDYKKPIVVQSDSLRKRKLRFSESVDSLVLKPARALYESGNKISALIRERNQQRLAGYRFRYQLYQFKMMSASDFDRYLDGMFTENHDDICWIKSNAGGLPRLFYGFRAMVFLNKGFEGALVQESKIERVRYSALEKELRRKRDQRLNIVYHDRRLVNLKTKEVKKSKSDFLKLLKAQRKAEKAAKD